LIKWRYKEEAKVKLTNLKNAQYSFVVGAVRKNTGASSNQP